MWTNPGPSGGDWVDRESQGPPDVSQFSPRTLRVLRSSYLDSVLSPTFRSPTRYPRRSCSDLETPVKTRGEGSPSLFVPFSPTELLSPEPCRLLSPTTGTLRPLDPYRGSSRPPSSSTDVHVHRPSQVGYVERRNPVVLFHGPSSRPSLLSNPRPTPRTSMNTDPLRQGTSGDGTRSLSSTDPPVDRPSFTVSDRLDHL